MKLLDWNLWRKEKSQPSPSKVPEAKAPHGWSLAGLRPSDVSYPVPYYAGATIEIPKTSPLYRDKSWKTWHLRKSACAWAWIMGIVAMSPMTGRKTRLIRAPFPMVMKYGTEIQLSEASTLRFVAKNTSIPVPKVYCAFEYRGMKFILMELVRGKRVVDVWDKKPPAVREILLKQLKGYFEELRTIPHPLPGAICSVDIGPLFDRRMDKDIRGFGPFANETDFNQFLRCGTTDPIELRPAADRFRDEKVRGEVATIIALQKKESHAIYFTHGDAHSRNFLVKGQKIVALIDFEMAGFYPEYWEYTTAMTTGNDSVFDDRWWKEELKKILKEYPQELQGEIIRQTHLAWRIREVVPRAD